MRDFTTQQYAQLLSAIRSNNISVYGVKDWVEQLPSHGIVMRHDVDRKPYNALEIAELEHEMGIASTYYFRITSNSFDTEIIRRIAKLGHEIGYHYEDLSLANGDYEKAIRLFEEHLKMLRKAAQVNSIAMHGRPLSPYDNRDLWKKYDYKDFGIIAEAFLTIDYSNVYYFTDTSRTWANTKTNLRDKSENSLYFPVKSTNDLISFINTQQELRIALITHPERWNSHNLPWLFQYGKDLILNSIKYVLYLARR